MKHVGIDVYKRQEYGNPWESSRQDFDFIQYSVVDVLSDMDFMSESAARNWCEKATESYQIRDVYKRQLQQKGLTHFDSWASTFGETTTAIELAPEGTGYLSLIQIYISLTAVPSTLAAACVLKSKMSRKSSCSK